MVVILWVFEVECLAREDQGISVNLEPFSTFNISRKEYFEPLYMKFHVTLYMKFPLASYYKTVEYTKCSKLFSGNPKNAKKVPKNDVFLETLTSHKCHLGQWYL